MSATPLGTRSLKFKVGATEFNMDATSVTIESAEADSDFVSFAQAAAGGAREYTLNFTSVQDPADSTSLWNQMWASSGSTVAVSINPYGGGTFSASNPGFTGNVVITEPDGVLLGGEADASTSGRHTFDCSWKFTAKPTKVTTGTY